MNTTREQLIEGRDEALEHLGIRPEEWEKLSHEKRRLRMRYEAARTPQKRAAALTVAHAEEGLALGLGFMHWRAAAFGIAFINPRSSTDYVLGA